MAKSKRTLVLFIVSGLIIIGTLIGFYLYNKGPKDVEYASGTKVAAPELYQAFISGGVSAKEKFTDKILEVSGQVIKIAQNQQNQAIIFLKTNQEGASINCTMEGAAENAKEGNNVSIKGICSGLEPGDADLGILGDVYLIRCYLEKE